MAVKKIIKKEAVKIPAKEKVVEVSKLEAERNALIDDLRPRLLTKTQLKQGGGDVKSRYAGEQGYAAIIDEINKLGKELGLPMIGLGHLRKE